MEKLLTIAFWSGTLGVFTTLDLLLVCNVLASSLPNISHQFKLIAGSIFEILLYPAGAFAIWFNGQTDAPGISFLVTCTVYLFLQFFFVGFIFAYFITMLKSKRKESVTQNKEVKL